MDLTPLLQLMHDKNASDLYLTVGIPPTMRIDGKTTPVAEESLTPDGAMEMVTSMMSPAQREEFDATHECNFAISAEGIGRFMPAPLSSATMPVSCCVVSRPTSRPSRS